MMIMGGGRDKEGRKEEIENPFMLLCGRHMKNGGPLDGGGRNAPPPKLACGR